LAKHKAVTSPAAEETDARRSKLRWRERRTLECAGSLTITVLISAALVFLVELIARGSLQQTLDFFQQPFRPGWTTVILFTLLLVGFDALFGRRHNGVLFVAPLALLLAAIGHQKSLYLGDPLYPTDFLYSRQIVELTPLLVRERPLTAIIIALGGAAAIFLLVAFWRYWRRRFPVIRWRMRVARLAVVLPALAFFVSIMDFAAFSWTRDRLQIIPIMWDQKENYASNGFAIAFALNMPMAKVKAPPSYEDDVLDAIRPGPIRISMPEEKPDIIVVMRIRRHDRQCRIRSADRLHQRLPALWQHSLSAICARAGAVAGEFLPLARL
jgi:phosphoglycerol transferase MdoB-like AlkP superfamily enzyme